MTPRTRPGPAATARTRGITATIEGMFALMWFAWARADAPASLRLPLELGGVAGLVVVVAGIAVAASRYGQPMPARDAHLRRRYNRIVLAELGLLGAGAAVLATVNLTDWIAVWVCAGVGLHFLPLARVSANPFLAGVGLAITAAAVAALVAGLTTTVAPSAIAGSAAGVCLLAAAAASLAGWFSGGRRRGASPT